MTWAIPPTRESGSYAVTTTQEPITLARRMPSFLRAFDSPNATEPVGRRNVTNVPAQSLALLNHPLVHQQSQKWGELILESKGSPEEKLRE